MAKKDTPETGVETRPTMAVSTDFLQELQESAGQGFENVSMRDVAIPFLTILQSNSPQVKKGPARIEGAEEGDVFHTVQQRALKTDKEEFRVVLCGFQKRWVEWVDRDSGGGFVMSHLTDDILKKCTKNDKGKDVLPNGHLIVETAYHYVIFIHPDGTFEQAVIGMSSTALKKSRRWMSQLMSIQIENNGKKFNPPMYAHSWSMKTTMETKDTNTWFNWDMREPQLLKDPELYHKAKDFYKLISETGIEVTPTTQDAPSSSEVTDY